MNEEVRDGEVSLEVPRNAATLDFGVLRKAATGPWGATLDKQDAKRSLRRPRWMYTDLGPGSQNGNPGSYSLDNTHEEGHLEPCGSRCSF